MSTKYELVFIPSPELGHLLLAVEMAKLLVDCDERLLITVLIMKLPFDSEIDFHVESLATSITADIHFVLLMCNLVHELLICLMRPLNFSPIYNTISEFIICLMKSLNFLYMFNIVSKLHENIQSSL
ncbi:hypothetical protein ACJRO7_014351 [Eucalyptus globulus]|uniref:Uncharacterized protein n=1 Tax=Eucalyptus globulus TaxID=34317 RepID=A0ABD3L5T8_EUCGL